MQTSSPCRVFALIAPLINDSDVLQTRPRNSPYQKIATDTFTEAPQTHRKVLKT